RLHEFPVCGSGGPADPHDDDGSDNANSASPERDASSTAAPRSGPFVTEPARQKLEGDDADRKRQKRTEEPRVENGDEETGAEHGRPPARDRLDVGGLEPLAHGSNTTSGAPPSTVSPGWTSTLAIRPARAAETSFSIFIASMTRRDAPRSTS